MNTRSDDRNGADISPPRTGRARTPWPEAYPDRRKGLMLAKDGLRVAAQTRGLDRTRAGDAWRDGATRTIVAQRAEFPELPQIDLLRHRKDLVAIISGDLLVRPAVTEDLQLWPLLQTYATRVESVGTLDNRLLRLRTRLSAQHLDALARVVRHAGYEASVSHVTPLAPYAKGQGGAEQTEASVPLGATDVREARNQVSVIVIDTGITREPRTDGWVTGLAAADASNIDPLDVVPADGFLDMGAGHGTFAAGIVQQVAPMADLHVLRAIQSDGIGDEVDVAVKIVEAVRSADASIPLIINLSLGAETIDDQPLLAIEVALEIAYELHPDCLVVAAAGNSGWSRPCFPAASRSVVAVGALQADLTPAHWSNHGFWVDCSVVGEGIVSTYVPGQESTEADDTPDTWVGPNPWALWSGTSFAAPQVAGAVARRVAEAGGTTREALAWLFAQAPRVPDMGHVLQLLPGTPQA